MIIPKNSFPPSRSFPAIILLYALLIMPFVIRSQPNAVLSNPSACGLNEPLTDFNCPENVNFYNPDIFEIQVTNAPGSVMGVDVFLQEVRLLIEHEWVSDINVALRAPGGLEAELFGNSGGNGDNFGDTSLVACTGAMVLRMAACNSVSNGVAPFTDGPYRPKNDFYVFNDESTNPNGTWELLICDDLDDDTGVLQYVELVFAPLSCLPVQDVVLLNQDTTGATFTYTPEAICGAAIVEIGPPGFIPGTDENPGQGQVFNVGCPPFSLTGLAEDTTYDIYLRRTCDGGTSFSDNSCVSSFQTGCSPAPVTLLETFDSEDTCDPFCGTSCELAGSWRNVEGDDFDWLTFSGPTPTLVGTGPIDDITGGGNYVYIEANGSQCNTGGRAYLQSSCLILDKQGTDSCHLSFSYHMSGVQTGSLAVAASDDGGFSWTSLWQISGQQDNSWQRAYVSLADYPDGTELQLRIVATKGGGIFGDIAVDHIRLHGSTQLGFPDNLAYPDVDGDGFGADVAAVTSCLDTPPAGYAFNNTDCDDGNPNVFPGAEEIPCNGIDENCNASMQDDDPILPIPVMTNDTVCSGSLPLISAESNPDFQVFWYTSPDRCCGIVWVGNDYQPSLPPNNTAFPQFYSFYAEVTNFVCSTPVLGEATIMVLPAPEGSIATPPQTCPGEDFDLAGIDIQDTHFTGATLSFHEESPATPQNELPTTIVNLETTSSYTYLLTSPDACTFEGEVTVELKERPQIMFSPADSFSICTEVRDTVVATAAGAVPPYEYLWGNGRTANTLPVQGLFTPDVLQEFTLSVTDAEGCASVDTLKMLTISSIDSLRTFTSPVTVCEGSDGSMSIIPLAGVPPFAYVWEDESGNMGSGNNISDTILIDNLPQNTYRVSITDASGNGCQVFLRNIRIQGPGFQLGETTLRSPSCAGFDDGEICLDVSGMGAITYSWSDGQDAACAVNLTAGTYTVTITNGDCTAVESYILTEPDSISVLVQETAPSCADAADGGLVISAFGGTPNYNYLWENGFIIPQRINLTSGAYMLTVTDNRNCQFLDTISLLAPDPLEIDVDSLQHVSCPGAEDGLLRVSGSGGTAPYQFRWDNGSTSPLQIAQPPGEYFVTMTDFQGCTTTIAVSIGEPDPLVLALDSEEQPLCLGDETGSLSLTAGGGVPPYMYYWNDGFVGDTGIRTDLPVGEYQIVLEDANACTSDTLAIKLSPQSDLAISAVLTEPNCVGQSNGRIDIMTSGEPPHMYTWSTGETSGNLTNIPVGEYGLTVTDGRGCIADSVFVLEANQVFMINSSVVQPSCFGTDDGIIDQTLIEQGQPPFQFFWNFNNSQHVDQMFLGPGDYQFTVTDAVGCQFASDTFNLEYPQPLHLEVIDQLDIACAGDENGYIETNAIGGTSPYNYNWIGTGNTSPVIFDLGAGNHRLSVTDSRGCVKDTIFTLNDPAPLFVSAELELGNVCDTASVDVLSGIVNGGSGPYLFSWTGRVETQNIVNPSPGDYFLTVTDANGCSNVFGTIKVQERIEPLVLDSFIVQQVSCFDGMDASLAAFTSGGSERLRYHFSPTYIEESDSNVVRVSGLGFNQFYRVTVTDMETGCEVESGAVAGFQPEPLAIVRDSFSVVNCFGGADGSIYVSVSGGTEPYLYNWTNEEGTTVSTQEDHRFAQAGIFELLVTDANNCTQTFADSNVISVNELMVITDTLINSVSCRGGSDGLIDIEIEGGAPPYSYLWSNDHETEDLTNISAGVYTLTVTDSDTCRAIFPSLRINQPETLLILDGTADTVSCFGFNDGNIAASIVGGDEPYVYRWRRNGVLIPSLNELVIDELIAGAYRLEVTDANGCNKNILFNVGTPPELLLSIINEPQGVDSLLANISGGMPPYDFLWSTGDTTVSITDLQSSSYELFVTDEAGCTVLSTFLLTESWSPDVTDQGAIRFYPNPTTGLLNLEIRDDIQLSSSVLYVRNAFGQLIETHELPLGTQMHEIDLSGLPAGSYHLELIERAGTRQWKSWLIKL